MLRIKILLESRRASVLILILAVLSRMMIQLYFFRTGVDRSVQLVGAKNLLGGNGLNYNHVLIENLSEQVYSPFVGWPPGYPVFISFLGAVLHDITIAAIVFDLISIFIFVFFTRKMLQLLGCSALVVNCNTIITGFFLYDFCQISSPDMSAIAFLICAFYMTLNYLKKEKKSNLYVAGIALINFIPAFLRYMFIPIALVIPVYLLIAGSLSKDKRIARAGLISSLITILFICGLLVFQSSYTGEATYVSEARKGFYPENLKHFFPVVIAAFANISFIYAVLENVGFRYSQFNGAVWLLNIFLFSTLVVLLIKLFLQRKFRSLNPTEHFIYVGSLISLVITTLLIALSLRYAALERPDYEWTFVQESRYMAFVVVFLQQLAFILIFKNWPLLKNRLAKLAGFTIIILFCLELLHGIYFISKLVLTDKTYFHPDKNYILQKEFIKELVRYHKKSPSRDLIFASAEKTYLNIASLHGASVLYNYDPAKTLKSTRPFVLLILVKNEYHGEFASLLTDNSAMPIKTIGNLSFYEYRSD